MLAFAQIICSVLTRHTSLQHGLTKHARALQPKLALSEKWAHVPREWIQGGNALPVSCITGGAGLRHATCVGR